jgi:penicillin-binding protein 1B
MLSNAPRSYQVEGESWEPENYKELPEIEVSMRDALARSVNRATVDLAMKTGLDTILHTVEAFQFSTPFRALPSVALGAFEVIPLELARAYCAFASDGLLPNPLSLKGVLDENGKILERRHMTIERVISPAKSYIINSMLRSAVHTGTARSLKDLGITFPVAGKTGTTNEYRDAWFVGYTPEILALVWVGFDGGASIHAAGSAAALPIWAELMKAIPQYVSGNWFPVPPGITQKTVCPRSGQLAVRGACPDPKEEIFLIDHVPETRCPLHRGANPFNPILRRFRGVF